VLALWRGIGLEELCERLLPVGQERIAWAKMAAERAVELCRDGRPLFVAGHSLGAALAVLAAQQADRLGSTPRGVYVYGMPRVGGARFRDEYNARLGDITYRLVHGDDIVACIPFSGIGFRHVGRMLACTSGERFAAGAPLSDHSCDAPLPSCGEFVADSLARAASGTPRS
jgi:hypothetical protein